MVSLPAGVFNPYSGVKTSILILDKSLAKKTGRIGFFKVENDGYDLGAQRRPIDKNDLPRVRAELGEYLRRLRAGESVDAIQPTPTDRVAEPGAQYKTDNFQPTLGLIAEKEKIAAGGDYNLSGERYRVSAQTNSEWPMVELGKMCQVINGSTPSKRERRFWEGAHIPWFTVDDIRKSGRRITATKKHVSQSALDETSLRLLPTKAVLLSCTASVGEYAIAEIPLTTNQQFNGLVIKEPYSSRLIPDFLFLLASQLKGELIRLSGKTSFNFVSGRTLQGIQIPLPPLEVQREIVAEIEGYQRVIDGARAVVDNYRPHIAIDPEWPMVELGDICTMGGSITKTVNPTLPYFGSDSIESHTGKFLKVETAQNQGVSGPVYEFSGERLLYSKIRPYLNKLGIVDIHGYCSSDIYPLITNSSKIKIHYLSVYMLSESFNQRIRHHYERASIPKINRSQLFHTEIPLPPPDTQQAIVAEIEAEQALVAANRELIERFKRKIQVAIARVWGENETSEPATSVGFETLKRWNQ